MIHREGLILEVNRAVLEITGYSREELVGNNLLELVHPEDRGKVSYSGLTLEDPKQTNEYRVLHRDGSVKYVTETSWGVFDQEG